RQDRRTRPGSTRESRSYPGPCAPAEHWSLERPRRRQVTLLLGQLASLVRQEVLHRRTALEHPESSLDGVTRRHRQKRELAAQIEDPDLVPFLDPVLLPELLGDDDPPLLRDGHGRHRHTAPPARGV